MDSINFTLLSLDLSVWRKITESGPKVADEEVDDARSGAQLSRRQSTIRARKAKLKDHYRRWVANNPRRRVWNEDLNAYIYVRASSINELLNQVAINIDVLYAFGNLTEILREAVLVEECPPKDNRNQAGFEKVLIMRTADDIKVVVGVQRASHELTCYCLNNDKRG